ncbi:hypothetical protein BC943DRAFT_186110 [Umbelopsis sp. AD052]|nr:hypothetical protein BC943DRAFT_186110 [Umbelopsis sp. AD052]
MSIDKTLEEFIAQTIETHRKDLRELAKQIHDHPEVGFEEKFAHEYLTKLLEEKGFAVERHAGGIETAFVATYDTGKPGPRIGVCSEFDALQLSDNLVCHACGHNLIATVGVATALSLRYAVAEPSYQGGGKIVLFGTPAEEGQGGKNYMLDAGLFEQVDVCMMAHPSNGSKQFGRTPTIARQSIKVEYFGKPAHAGGMPWKGVNALDAMVLAYNGISTLRQQLTPNDRIHGIITNGGSAPNVIPDYTSGQFTVRALKKDQLEQLQSKVEKIFRSAADATGCEIKLSWDKNPYLDTMHNKKMMNVFSTAMESLGFADINPGVENPPPVTASTDFGNVSYAMPGIHPMFGINTPHFPHTAGFADAAATDDGFEAALVTARALTVTGMSVLQDDQFYHQVVEEFKQIEIDGKTKDDSIY